MKFRRTPIEQRIFNKGLALMACARWVGLLLCGRGDGASLRWCRDGPAMATAARLAEGGARGGARGVDAWAHHSSLIPSTHRLPKTFGPISNSIRHFPPYNETLATGRSLSPKTSFFSSNRSEEEINYLILSPSEPVLELARLAVDSGADPGAIQRALDPTILPAPDVEGSYEDRCQLTRTPYILEGLVYYFTQENILYMTKKFFHSIWAIAKMGLMLFTMIQ